MCGGHGAIRPYSWPVSARVIAFLLALLVAAGVASAAGAPSSSPLAVADVAGLVDDRAADAEPAVADLPTLLVTPVRREMRQPSAPGGATDGRLHLASVFRPPRRVAFR